MAKNKLKRFAVNALRDNVIEEGKALYTEIKGKWNELYFGNTNPITVELGCGDGEYTVGLARVFQNQNYVGIDKKGARIFQGSTKAVEENLLNTGFLRTKIEWLEQFFEPNEISEIWITFPDPQPKDRNEKHRLTHVRFLSIYQKLLKKDGWVRFKTDSRPLFDYTLEVLLQQNITNLSYTFDLYEDTTLAALHHGIQTKYEKMFRAEGYKINYLQFQFA